MSHQVYEVMFILDSNRYGRDPNGTADQIKQMIEGIGGEILVSRLWEERRLAYPINGQRKGTYWLTYFRSESTRLTELDQLSGRNENVLRHLCLSVDPRIVDALVAHARGETPAPADDAAETVEQEQPEEATAG